MNEEVLARIGDHVCRVGLRRGRDIINRTNIRHLEMLLLLLERKVERKNCIDR